MNPDGTVELITAVHPFTNINTLTLYITENYGHETTALRYVGMQGEHTHFRREAVDTIYEVLCNGQDIEQPEDALGGTATAHHMH